MFTNRHHVTLHKPTICLAVLIAILDISIPINISAQMPEPDVIYQNDFNLGTDSMTNTTGNQTGNITFDSKNTVTSEVGNNIGIGAGPASSDSEYTVLFGFTDKQTEGIISYCFDVSLSGSLNSAQTGYVQPFNVVLNKYIKIKTSLNIIDNTIFVPSGDAAASPSAEYTDDKIYHVQQIFDLNSKKMYTYVNGKPLLYTDSGGISSAGKSLDADFSLSNICILLSPNTAYFDNLRIEYASSPGETFNITDISAGDDNRTVCVTFSEPICADSYTKENFEVTTADGNAVAVSDVYYDGCCGVKLVLTDAAENETVLVKAANTAAHTVSTPVGARLADNTAARAVIFHDTIIYNNDFNDFDSEEQNPVSLAPEALAPEALQAEDSSIQNGNGWVAEKTDNKNTRLKLVSENSLTVTNNCDYKNFALSFDLQPKDPGQDSAVHETSVNLSYTPDNSNAPKNIKILSFKRQYSKFNSSYKALISGCTAPTPSKTYDCDKNYHIDIAYNPQRNAVYSYLNGECIGESILSDDTKFEKLIIDFADNTGYLDNMKIYEFNSCTQSIRITDAQPKASSITIQTAEPLNAKEISADNFSVAKNGTATEISDVSLKDNNTLAVITLAQPVSGGANYTVTAKKGLKNFANMSNERDLSVTVAVARNVSMIDCKLSDDNRTVSATVQNNEAGPSTAVLVVCAYKNDSDIPDKILTDEVFTVENTPRATTLEPDEKGDLSVTADFSRDDRIVVYFWTDLDSCAPYCNPITLKPHKNI